MGDGNIMAKTDGSLQIQIPDPHSPGAKILWNRQYYAVPLEVPSSLLQLVKLLFLYLPLRCLMYSMVDARRNDIFEKARKRK